MLNEKIGEETIPINMMITKICIVKNWKKYIKRLMVTIFEFWDYG